MSLPKNLSSPFLETKPLQKTNFTTSDADTHDSFLEQDNDDDDDGEILGVILGRSNPRLSAYFDKQPTSAVESSGSTSTRTISMRLSDKRGSVVESVVRRAFSMRVSAPVVSEGYHRIDHRCNSDEDDQCLIAADADARRRTRTNKRKANIFEACRRLLGF